MEICYGQTEQQA